MVTGERYNRLSYGPVDEIDWWFALPEEQIANGYARQQLH